LADRNITGERYIVSAENITHRRYLDLIADAMHRPRPRVLISPFHAKIAATAEVIRSTLTGNPPRINMKTLEIASKTLTYSNTKIRDTLGMSFIPIEESVNYSVQLFMNEMNSGY